MTRWSYSNSATTAVWCNKAILGKCDWICEKGRFLIFWWLSNCHISTTIDDSGMILGTVQELNFNKFHPTLKAWSFRCSRDACLYSSVIICKTHNHKCCKLCPVTTPQWFCSFPCHCYSNASSIKHPRIELWKYTYLKCLHFKMHDMVPFTNLVTNINYA